MIPECARSRPNLSIDGAAEKEEPCYDTDRGGPGSVAALLLTTGLFACGVETETEDQSYPAMTTVADYQRAMEELSNWGRWGADDELGASNLITPAKRRAAAALVTEGLSVSLAHDVIQETALDATAILNREVLRVSATGASDRYQYTGSYHGVIHSHLDAVDCHIMYEGKGIQRCGDGGHRGGGWVPGRGSINALKDGIVHTRHPVRRDAPCRATSRPEGWVEPGTAIRAADLEALEEIEGVRVEPGDVILLYTGRWKRRAALGPWPTSEGVPVTTPTSLTS